MLARWMVPSVLLATFGAACGHDEHWPLQEPSAPVPRARPSALEWPQYVIADPVPSRALIMLPLATSGAHGLVVDKRRVVVGRGDPRVAVDVTSESIVGASKLPVRFGGGFLFWTANDLYRSDAFDSTLAPIVRVPDPIDAISFAPKSLLVRTKNGERWSIDLPHGERAPVLPLGLADVKALDDGRAIAMSDQGSAFTSIDHGAHWTDVSVQIGSAPSKVAIVDGDLWLFDSGTGAYRLEPDGRLSSFDRAPLEPPPEVRPRDPRWRGSEPLLRAAFRGGASLDDRTAIVLDAGDLVRVDVHTGEVLSVVSGRLPPDAQCEAVPTAGDVLFACASRSSSGSAFVVSHTLSSDSPIVEQTLPGGEQFYASADGGLAYSGSCDGSSQASNGAPVVCVRTPGGRWEQHDLTGLQADAGSSPAVVSRWVPRADGRVVAIVSEPKAGIADPTTGEFQPISEEAHAVAGRAPPAYPLRSTRYGSSLRLRRSSSHLSVDGSWSFVGERALRGWQRHGEAVEISEDGKLTRSAYAFDVAFAGAMGLGRSKDGRLYQSSDYGASWVEVAAPPGGLESSDLLGCSSAGCDLGSFYRVGWSLRPPKVDPPKSIAPAAPSVRRVRGLELADGTQA
ncbi:MAG TPA: hypothetical protein VM580_10910, partial [Labilithrix sp.]|nr:hypothetical protein [Labilithrix sp.]